MVGEPRRAELPGVEWVITASVLVFAALVVSRTRLRPDTMMSLVGFFAFFHGFAHGQELPGAANLVMFGAGFLLATLLLRVIRKSSGCFLAIL